jgi:hypothetical protein
MKIFKELKKLGYIHYSATTIEELDDLPLNSAERISEQALVLRWFREKYGYWSYVKEATKGTARFYIEKFDEKFFNSEIYNSYQEAELECLKKLIKIVKNEKT